MIRDTTSHIDYYIETVQVCYSGLNQCWLKLCRTDWTLSTEARSLQAGCRHSKSAPPAQPVIVFVVRVCVCNVQYKKLSYNAENASKPKDCAS